MMTRHISLRTLCSLYFGPLFAMMPFFATSVAYAVPNVEELRNHLIHWSQSLTSFSGEYELDEELFEVTDEDPTRHYRIDFKFMGEDIYFESHYGANESLELSMARLNGKNSYRLMDPDSKHPVGSVGRDQDWSLPSGAYILPFELFGNEIGSASMAEILGGGNSAVFEEEGLLRFCHRNKNLSKYVDVILSPDFTVLRWELVTWYKPSPEEMAQLSIADPIRATIPKMVYELGNHMEIGGVRFPTWAQTRLYQPDVTEAKALQASVRSGETSRGEYIEKMMHTVPLLELRRLTFKADPLKIQVNPALSGGDFNLDFPEGAEIYNAAKSENILVGPWYKRYKIDVPAVTRILIAFFVALGVTCAIIMIYRRSRNSQTLT